MSGTTVAATLAIDMLRYLERRGISTRDCCAAAGIDPTIVARPDERIPRARMAALWDAAVASTGDPLVAVHMAEEFHPAALDILGYVVLTCRTIGDVVDCLSRFAGLLNDSMRVAVVHDGPRVVLRLDLKDGRDSEAVVSEARYVADSMWIGMARQLRSLAARPVIPLEVWFRHTVADDREYRRLLGAPVCFGAAEDRFVLRSSDLSVPLPSANPALFSVFEQHASALLESLSDRDTMVAKVSQVVVQRLKGRVPTVGEVASAMAMSARNLQRVLHAEDTSFQQVLDSVRGALARHYLADTKHSVSQVAFLLGFSEAAAFHRAFKKWTGTTPALARRTLHHE